MNNKAKVVVNDANDAVTVFVNDNVTNIAVNVNDVNVAAKINIIENYECEVVEPIRVSNSNDSYDVTTSTDLELPNINFTDSDGSVRSIPSMEDVTAILSLPKSGISYMRNYYTLQTNSFAVYDDGWQFTNGGYDYIDLPNPLYTQRLDMVTDPTGRTLYYDNHFGNKIRFTDINGDLALPINGQYVIDNLTGLGWWDKRDMDVSSWDDKFGVGGKLDNFNNSGLGGYNDFMLPNILILQTINNFQTFIYTERTGVMLPYTSLPSSFSFASSTTRPTVTTNIMYLHQQAYTYVGHKSQLYASLYCRVHFK